MIVLMIISMIIPAIRLITMTMTMSVSTMTMAMSNVTKHNKTNNIDTKSNTSNNQYQLWIFNRFNFLQSNQICCNCHRPHNIYTKNL